MISMITGNLDYWQMLRAILNAILRFWLRKVKHYFFIKNEHADVRSISKNSKKTDQQIHLHDSDQYQKEIDQVIYFSPMVGFYVVLQRRNKKRTCRGSMMNKHHAKAASLTHAENRQRHKAASSTPVEHIQADVNLLSSTLLLRRHHCHGAVIVVVVVKALLQCCH